VSGSVSVSNLPAVQQVGGTVNVGNLPATQAVAGTVGIDPARNTVHVDNPEGGIPAREFSIPPTYGGTSGRGSSDQAPDPAGTRYAITSFTVVTEPSSRTAAVEIALGVGGFNGPAPANCGVSQPLSSSFGGPVLVVPGQDTRTISFPQAFVTPAVSGEHVCLMTFLSNTGDNTPIKWSAVGYRLP
jgi:hypothetical protein